MAAMETYTAMRQFADSWGLVVLMLFFIGVIVFVFRPGSRQTYEDNARIPLRNDNED